MQNLEDQIEYLVENINWINIQQLFLVHSINQGYLLNSIYIIVNDPTRKYQADQITNKLKNYKTLPKFKPALLVAKSNCLRYFMNCKEQDEMKEDFKLGKLVAFIIQYQEQIQTQIVQEQQRSITPFKQKFKTSNNFKLINSQKGLHKKNQHSSQLILLEQKVTTKIKQDKLLRQLQEQKMKEDEYNRYKIWFEQNQQLKKEKQQQQLEERKTSREFHSRSKSPNRISNMSLDERIKLLKNEIKDIEIHNGKPQ